MDWREVTIYTTTEGIGPVEALLEDNGVEGYVLEDAADFEEFLKDTEIYWDYVDEDLVREKRAQETCLKIYLPDSDEGAKQYADIRAALENLKARDEEHAWGRLCTETALTRQEDWEWGWKQYFKPFPVGRGFMIKPSWETVEDPQGRRILEIDPVTLKVVWSYVGGDTHKGAMGAFITNTRFYSQLISAAQRLPNGNTMITEGCCSRIFEVTPDKEVVWEYIAPFNKESEGMFVYRAYRYPYDYVPQLDTPEEVPVEPLDITTFRVPGAAEGMLQNFTEVPEALGYTSEMAACVTDDQIDDSAEEVDPDDEVTGAKF
mgnify:CR=1 FL=1